MFLESLIKDSMPEDCKALGPPAETTVERPVLRNLNNDWQAAELQQLREDVSREVARRCSGLQEELRDELRQLGERVQLGLDELRLELSQKQFQPDGQLTCNQEILTSEVSELQNELRRLQKGEGECYENILMKLREEARKELQEAVVDSRCGAKQLRADLDRECRAAGLDLVAHIEQRVTKLVQESVTETQVGLQDFHQQLSSAFESAGQACYATQTRIEEVRQEVEAELQGMASLHDQLRDSVSADIADCKSQCQALNQGLTLATKQLREVQLQAQAPAESHTGAATAVPGPPAVEVRAPALDVQLEIGTEMSSAADGATDGQRGDDDATAKDELNSRSCHVEAWQLDSDSWAADDRGCASESETDLPADIEDGIVACPQVDGGLSAKEAISAAVADSIARRLSGSRLSIGSSPAKEDAMRALSELRACSLALASRNEDVETSPSASAPESELGGGTAALDEEGNNSLDPSPSSAEPGLLSHGYREHIGDETAVNREEAPSKEEENEEAEEDEEDEVWHCGDQRDEYSDTCWTPMASSSSPIAVTTPRRTGRACSARLSSPPHQARTPHTVPGAGRASIQESDVGSSPHAQSPSTNRRLTAPAHLQQGGAAASSCSSGSRRASMRHDSSALKLAILVTGDASCTIYLPKQHPILALKEAIAKKTAVPSHQQILRLGSRKLCDHERLLEVLPEKQRATICLIRTGNPPGSWLCHSCEVLNYRGRLKCKDCHTTKPEVPTWGQGK